MVKTSDTEIFSRSQKGFLLSKKLHTQILFSNIRTKMLFDLKLEYQLHLIKNNKLFNMSKRHFKKGSQNFTPTFS